jgi:ketosteroid isomerase-like protein
MVTYVRGTVLAIMLLSGCAGTSHQSAPTDLKTQVMNVERAFAKTMADRDHAAFTSFVSDEAVFFSSSTPLRGRQQVAEWWKRFYEKKEAPFSWEPEKVEVLDSGTLALSTGPVHNPEGKLVGTFTSIWRQEQPGVWRIIFDKGNEVCDEKKK